MPLKLEGQAPPESLRAQAQLMIQIGNVFLSQGRFEQARVRFEEAHTTARAAGAHDVEAASLGLLAAHEAIAGRYEDALRYQDEALAIFHTMGYRSQEAELLTLTSTTYIQLGSYREALERLARAAEITHEIGEEAAGALGALREATIYFHLGEIEKSFVAARRSLELAHRYQSPLEEADALVALGWIHQRRGEWKSALASLERAWALARAGGHRGGELSADLATGFVSFQAKNDTAAAAAFSSVLEAARAMGNESAELMALTALAATRHRHGEKAAAVEMLEQVAAKLDVHLGRLQVGEFAASFSSLQPNGVHAVLAQRYAEQGEIATAFLHAERARARAFLEQLGRPWQALETAGSDARSHEVRSLAEEIVQLENTLDQTRSADVKKWHSAGTTELRETLASKREQFRRALTDLELHQPEAAALVSVDASTLEQVAASLDPETTLVAYFVLENKVLAWVVDRESATLATLPIRREKLDQDVELLADGLASRDFDRALASRLYDELITPLRAELRHRQLIIVAHDALHELPFAALWNAREGRYFLEEHALAFAPSASVLRFLAAKRSPNEGRMSVLGNPDGSLPGAEQEARAIAFLYGTEPHLGAEASEARLRAAGSGIDLLHLAAHGRLDEQQPQFSSLELAAGDGRDGHLEVHEIFGGLDLRGVNLVVLSACQSGRGERSRGDDLLGLTRAFLYAGSPAVLSTLWSIDDNASSFLMETFYGRLHLGESAAEALRQAQLATLGRLEFSTPYHWAAFMLNGDWKSVAASR